MMLTSALTSCSSSSLRSRIFWMRYGKLAARLVCSSPIEPELSITNRMSSRLHEPSVVWQPVTTSVSSDGRSSFIIEVSLVSVTAVVVGSVVALVFEMLPTEATVVVLSSLPPLSSPHAPSSPAHSASAGRPPGR
ncbi:hypothetical protein [Nannocystis sp.]|uniref:hypothetical protein n=1 Tax=Nannocystis sp. TaxID=1962667 RepID=UPI0025D21842|nr:hypothetical protein [Nannocystis sp.]MBK7826381.1 hypothetical protein [Nannocystis sp.]